MTHATMEKKKNTGAVGSAGGEMVGGFIELVELCREILERSEQGEFYLPEDLTERIREDDKTSRFYFVINTPTKHYNLLRKRKRKSA